jgi:hypothetical protein
MAYTIATPDHYKQNKDFADALSEFDNPFVYDEDVSLANYKGLNEDAKAKLKIRNESWKKFLLNDAALQTAQSLVDKKLIQLRNCIKGVKGEDSDEYVAAGGIRRSDITAQAQATRADKKKNTPPKA